MKIRDIKIAPLTKSKFIKPYKITYFQDDKFISWDCIEVFDGVMSVLYHKEFDSFIFVKQFRAPLWAYQQRNNQLIKDGMSIELCGGIMDKNRSQEETIIEEIFEECGYRVESVEKICDNFSSVAIGAAKQGLFFAIVDESMRVGSGGGVDYEESIDLVFVKKDEVLDFINNTPTSAVLKYGIMMALKRLS